MTKDEALAFDLALEALEEACEIVGAAWTWRDEKGRPAITAIKQARSAPVQEPVANIRTWHKNGEQHAELWNWDKGIEGLPDGEHNLYTTPPVAQRQCEDEK